MKKTIAAAIIAFAALPLLMTGCANNQETGTVVGAVTGGIIGNQFGKGSGRAAATVAGVLVGGLIGNQIGKDLDDEERERALEAEYRALEYGPDDEPTEWRGSRDGYHGYTKPGRRYTQHNMQCREFTSTIYINGRPETARGKACRRPDGTWKQV
jgi:surface antigen